MTTGFSNMEVFGDLNKGKLCRIVGSKAYLEGLRDSGEAELERKSTDNF